MDLTVGATQWCHLWRTEAHQRLRADVRNHYLVYLLDMLVGQVMIWLSSHCCVPD